VPLLSRFGSGAASDFFLSNQDIAGTEGVGEGRKERARRRAGCSAKEGDDRECEVMRTDSDVYRPRPPRAAHAFLSAAAPGAAVSAGSLTVHGCTALMRAASS
jgi:hypothetical protein